MSASVPLYSTRQITVATAIGTPIMGGILLALNLRRSGSTKAAGAVIAGVIITAATVLAGVGLSRDVAPLLPFLGLAAMRAISRAMVPDSVAPANQASWRAPLAIGFGVLVPLIAAYVYFGVLTATARVTFGHGHEVEFTEGATEREARVVGALLTSSGYFLPDHPASVRVEHEGNRTVVSFAVREDAWTHEDIIATFRAARSRLADELGSTTIVRLCDGNFTPHATLE